MHTERPDSVESIPHPTRPDDLDQFVLDPPEERGNDSRSNDHPSDEECELDSPGYGFGV